MIELYDGNLAFVGPLDHVVKWGYEQKNNELSTATIILPADDEVNAQIVVPASWARLYDGEEDLGFFRFSAITAEEHTPGGTITYQLQSAQCTLLDGMLSGWHELGGTGYPTRQVLEYILAQQAVPRWVLGVCDFEDYYQYNFEDVTQLEGIMSLGEVVLGDYAFVFDSTVTPWTMHMLRPGSEAYCSLVYRRTMTAIKRSVEGAVVTRLYGRGYGEGDNQLTIASVNNGLEYIDAPADAIARWGIREGVHVDTRQTDPATLKARMEQILAAGCSPQVSYEAEAIDLYKVTGESWDYVACGAKVLVLDEALGAPVTVKVTSRKKDDVEGDPGRISYVLDNSRPDTAEELNEILDKIGVHELYSQGATNMYSMQISDNADASHPLVMRFYVPGNVLRINSCLIYWQLEAFRTYTTLAASGGGAAKTSESGGGATVTLPGRTIRVEQVSAGAIDTDGGSVNNTGDSSATNTGTGGSGNTGASSGSTASSNAFDTDTGGSGNTGASSGSTASSSALTTGGAGGHSHNGNSHRHSAADTHRHTQGDTYTTYNSAGYTTYTSAGTSTVDDHTHSVPAHTHGLNAHQHAIPGHVHSVPAHTHGLNAHQHGIPGHNHSMAHTHPMDHLHSITHEHVIPAMSFELEGHSHTVNIPSHTHELEYGVYEGSRAGGVSLIVDGEAVPADAIGDAREFNVAAYLRKNDDGKVTRSAWHEVEFVPDALTRITADLFFQVFIQSRGAGDY